MKCLLPYKCVISLPGVMFGFVKGDLPPHKRLKERAIQRQILKKKKKKKYEGKLSPRRSVCSEWHVSPHLKAKFSLEAKCFKINCPQQLIVLSAATHQEKKTHSETDCLTHLKKQIKSFKFLAYFIFLIMIFFQLTHVIFYIFAIKHEYNSFLRVS